LALGFSNHHRDPGDAAQLADSAAGKLLIATRSRFTGPPRRRAWRAAMRLANLLGGDGGLALPIKSG